MQVMGELLAMGPPVYFVLSTSLSLSERSNQNLLCGGQLCDNNSIVTELYVASTNSEMYASVAHVKNENKIENFVIQFICILQN